MATYSNFISTEYIKIRGLIDDNVDDKLLTHYITVAQDLHTQIILGETLYFTLMDKINDNTLGTMYATLLNNYVQPGLMEWVVYESIPYINWKFTNRGIVSQTSEHATGISTSDLKWLKDLAMNKASFYDQRIREQIINNPSDYPEYYQLNGVERIAPATLTGFNYIYTSKMPRGNRGGRIDNNDCCAGPNGIQFNL
jgi:hypothetical protein